MGRLLLVLYVVFGCGLLTQGAAATDKNCFGEAFPQPPKKPGEIDIDDVAVGTTVWGKYKCTGCKQIVTGNPNDLTGTVDCPNCGKPQSKGEKAFLGKHDKFTQGEVVTTQADRTRAESGEHWNCSFCSAARYPSDPRCAGCGAEKDPIYEARKEELARHAAEESARSREIENPTYKGVPTSVKVAAGVGAAAAVGGGVYWATRETAMDAVVSNMAWSHTIQRETFTQKTERDWRRKIPRESPRMPVNGVGEIAGAENIRDCQNEKSGTKQVSDGMKDVEVDEPIEIKDPPTYDWQDNGNNSFTKVEVPHSHMGTHKVWKRVEQFHEEDVFEEKCTYDTYEWQPNGEPKSTTGTTSTPGTPLPWPKVAMGPIDRPRPSSSYRVTFSYRLKDKVMNVDKAYPTEEQFSQWTPGSNVVIKRNNLGAVSDDIQPKK